MERDDGELLAITAKLAKALYVPAGASMAKKKEPGIHKDFVTAVVQVVLFHCSIPKNASTTLADSVRAGYKGISDESAAKFFIFEWIKDGSATSKEARKEVLAGNYAGAWKFANTWLGKFGYERAVPEEISLSDTSYATIISERPVEER
jgi:hypothetical protein